MGMSRFGRLVAGLALLASVGVAAVVGSLVSGGHVGPSHGPLPTAPSGDLAVPGLGAPTPGTAAPSTALPGSGVENASPIASPGTIARPASPVASPAASASPTPTPRAVGIVRRAAVGV